MYKTMLDSGILESVQYKVLVDGAEIKVNSGGTYDFAQIFSSGIVEVTVSVAFDIEDIKIRPSRLNKPFTKTGERDFYFLLHCGEYISVEINGDISRPLLIFCDKKQLPAAYSSSKLIYFSKNTFYDAGIIEPQSDTVIFIDEGAVVDGAIYADNVKNVRILGNGILKRTDHNKFHKHPICFENSENIEINGITVLGWHHWNIRMFNCNNWLVKNTKILAHEIWSDGIDIVGGNNILISHIFIKNEDDCVCIKSSVINEENPEKTIGIDVSNVLVEDCVLWSGPRGNSMEIGYETNNSEIHSVTFRNIDVIHRQTQENKFNRAVIAIHNAGNAYVHDILYENIYAEHSDENLFYFSHMYFPEWGSGSGRIENITVRNFNLEGGNLPPSIITGYLDGSPELADEERYTKNIVFENLTVLNNKILSYADSEKAGFVISGVQGIKFL